MRRRPAAAVFALSLLMALASSTALAQAPARPAKLGQCMACHGEFGHARVPGVPHLAGQDAQYLSSALLAYRGGQRRHPLMNSIANTLQPRDIQSLALWFASQPPGRVR